MPAIYELAAATGAALLAGYVRARSNPSPLSLSAIAARAAEAIVCGFLAVGISAGMAWADHRVTVGLSAGLGLLGAGVISDLLTRFLTNRAGRV